MKKNKKKITKKPKIITLPRLRNKLFKLWSDAVRSSAKFKCEYCGIENKAININGVSTKLDAHHLVSRKVKDMPLKFDINNGICVCPICHKWGMPSFHRDPITTITWLMKNQPDKYRSVLEHKDVRNNLNNRTVLEYIHSCLVNKELLDYDVLKQMV